MNQTAETLDPFLADRFQTELEFIGSLLTYNNPALCKNALAICQPEHFSDKFLARIYGYIGQGIEQGLQSFPLSHWIISKLRDDATLNEIGFSASQMVARAIANAGPAIAVEGNARQIKHDHLRVELQVAAEANDSENAEIVAAEMERLSRAHLTNDGGMQSVGRAVNAVIERLSDAYQHGVIESLAYPGSLDLKNVLGGFRPGRFYVMAGRPGMGKTTTAMSLLRQTARKGHGVMVVSLEMGSDELGEIALCDLAYDPRNRIEYRDIQTSATDQLAFSQRFSIIQDAAREFQSLPMTISDTPGQTLADIRSAATKYGERLAAQGKRLEVICIDHLNLIKASNRYAGNKVAETEELSGGLKALAKELKVAVIALVQLNRGVEGRDDKRPSLSDLRWSGAIEQDADVVMFCYREAYYLTKPCSDPLDDTDRLNKLNETKNDLEIIFAKHRGGPCPTVKMFTDMGCGVVRDLAK